MVKSETKTYKGKKGATRIATAMKRRKNANKAVAFLRNQHKKGTHTCPHGWVWNNHCAHTVACAYGKTASGWNAYQGWEMTLNKHHHSGRNMNNPPRGALLFFKGGTYGHVCLSNGRKRAWTNDAPTVGKVGLVPVSYFTNNWGMQYVGWCWPDEVATW